MRGLLLLLAAPLLSMSVAHATTLAGDLEATCSSNAGTEYSKLCNAYMKGFLTGLFLADRSPGAEIVNLCIPESINTDVTRDLFLNFLAAHPEYKTWPAQAIMVSVAQLNYKCK